MALDKHVGLCSALLGLILTVLSRQSLGRVGSRVRQREVGQEEGLGSWRSHKTPLGTCTSRKKIQATQCSLLILGHSLRFRGLVSVRVGVASACRLVTVY